MRCKCVEELKKQFADKLLLMQDGKKDRFTGKVIERAELTPYGFVGLSMEFFTTSIMEVQFKDVKKKRNFTIIHSFCPFCGKKIQKDE